ncbi:hypothetical protein PV682_41215 [Streptomyces niveiscabiei]|uniref:hypothetical protein n=1 Tax=Streptomyces niveiscabiei TaxID=164115 RepID=UPI0029A9F802|nr:hypothetical protein [Streptomyces niveiscabiei]MDX3387819.1 hypothetical protein [Streptomyces niveiscabiei]
MLKGQAEAQLDRLDGIEEDLTARFGERSQARVFFLYEQLATVRTALLGKTEAAAHEILAERRGILCAKIQSLYDQDPFPAEMSTPVHRPPSAPGVIEYDGAVFERRYAEAAELIRHQVVPLDRWRPAVGNRPVGYMYVVDDTGALLVWDHPFTMAQMLVGRDKVVVGRWTVGHPMLVPDRRRVLAAGEIVPILGTETGAGLGGIVANLKSGHFRPPPEAAQAVVAACREQSGLPAHACDVFTIPPAPTSPRPPLRAPE